MKNSHPLAQPLRRRFRKPFFSRSGFGRILETQMFVLATVHATDEIKQPTGGYLLGPISSADDTFGLHLWPDCRQGLAMVYWFPPIS